MAWQRHRRCARAAVAVALAWTTAALAALGAPAAAQVPGNGRAWELVSVGPGKGVQVFQAFAWTADGDGLGFISVGPLPGAISGELLATSVARRTPSGWTVRRIGVPFTAPTAQFLGNHVLGTSADLDTWLWASVNPLVPGAPSSPSLGLYRLASDGALTLYGDLGSDGTFQFENPDAASADARHVAVTTNAQILPEDDRIAGQAAYEYTEAGPRLVGVDDAGVPLSQCGAAVGDGTSPVLRVRNPMSADGRRIFFTSPSPNNFLCAEPERVYLREDGADTTEISASRCTRPDCGAFLDVHFAGATPDGRHAFMTTATQLTNDDVDSGTDLYRYTVATGDLIRLSVPLGPEADVDASAIAVADAGDRVAFVARRALTPGEGADFEQNLYLWDRGDLRYVGRLEDAELATAGLSGDGDVLLFTTRAPLLPTDTDLQLDAYRYELAADTLTHISRGAQGQGNAALDLTPPPFLTPLPGQFHRSLSADGSRAFFVTPESLVPEDVNQLDDVYEWHDGALGLVSSGQPGHEPLTFESVSADGRSVFLRTDESLVPEDADGGDRDIYVARLGGGFPRPPAPAPCEGDACQGPLPGPLQGIAPDSAGSEAEGNHAAPSIAWALLPLARAARLRLVQAGRATVRLRTPVAGRVTVTGRARVDGRARIVARGSATADAPGTVRVRLRLRPLARRLLDESGSVLRVRLVAVHAEIDGARRAAVTLRGGAR